MFSNGDGIGDALWWDGFGENRIYHNDIFDNKNQISGRRNSVNFQYWDDGYPSGGNYWSDYRGEDANHDEIGDLPYWMTGEARDNFPLMKPWNSVQAVVDTESDWLGVDREEDWITVYIELPAGLPVKDIEVSTLRLNNTVSPQNKNFFTGDYDKDGIPDMSVKFSRQKVSQVFQSGEEVELIVSGSLKNGLLFEGSLSLKVISE